MTLIDIECKLFSVPGRTPKRKVVRSNRIGNRDKAVGLLLIMVYGFLLHVFKGVVQI